MPAKTLPLSRSRSVKRDIVGTHQIFVFYSLGDVRDGFARDCPHRHPVLPMLALRDRSGAAPSFFCGCRAISTVAGAAPRRRDTSGARWRRYAGDRLASPFPWSGWGARESLPGHPSHGRRIGPRHGPILSPSPSVVAPARVASRGHRRQRENAWLTVRIRAIHAASRGTYGSPRVSEQLKQEGFAVGRERVARLLRELGLMGVPPKRFRHTTESYRERRRPNLLNQATSACS